MAYRTLISLVLNLALCCIGDARPPSCDQKSSGRSRTIAESMVFNGILTSRYEIHESKIRYLREVCEALQGQALRFCRRSSLQFRCAYSRVSVHLSPRTKAIDVAQGFYDS